MNESNFLKADILCLLHDYGEMSVTGIQSILGAGRENIKDALFELVLEEKVREVGKYKYAAVDEVNVKRFKKSLPSIF